MRKFASTCGANTLPKQVQPKDQAVNVPISKLAVALERISYLITSFHGKLPSESGGEPSSIGK